MAKAKNEIVSILPDGAIMNKIYIIRGKKVMLDKYLAEMYGIEAKVLKQAWDLNLMINAENAKECDATMMIELLMPVTKKIKSC